MKTKNKVARLASQKVARDHYLAQGTGKCACGKTFTVGHLKTELDLLLRYGQMSSDD
jgi:hypothetical protein